MDQDREFLDALAQFQGAQAGVSAEAVDLCGTYKKVRPILNGILPFIKLIPRIGQPAATAIQALMSILDAACPTSTAQAAVTTGMSSQETEFMQALGEFQPTPSLASAQAVDICGTYKKVKPILQGILPFLRLIPVIGAGAATAVTLLMTALDALCPQT